MNIHPLGRRAPALLALVTLLDGGLAPRGVADEKLRKVPTSSTLDRIVLDYLALEEEARTARRAELDATYLPITSPRDLERIQKRALAALDQHGGRRLPTSGTHYFYDEETRRGKFIVRGARSDTLFIGLHGGGLGSGDAESMASGMGGGGWVWIFPEVLEKTEHGWVDSGSEEFVLELVLAARRTFGIDPDKVYLTGHSMGGHGTWTLAAHHPDIFAGGAAYAGAPTPYFRSPSDHTVVGIQDGILPNLYTQTFFFFQSGDDPQVPAAVNDFAARELAAWKQRYPDGYRYRYDRVEGRGHAEPAEGYLPTQQWVAEQVRDARPKRFLWQPTLSWKKHYYWLYWQRPVLGSFLEVKAENNRIEVDLREGGDDPGDLTLFVGPPLVDLAEEIVVVVQGKERFRGLAERRLSTLLWTLPWNDADRLFDARIDVATGE